MLFIFVLLCIHHMPCVCACTPVLCDHVAVEWLPCHDPFCSIREGIATAVVWVSSLV